MATPIEKIIMKETLLGGGRRRYVKGKSFAPPFEADFDKNIVPMLKTHPRYFEVVYARQVAAKDDFETDDLQKEADLKNEALRRKIEEEKANLEAGKKGKK